MKRILVLDDSPAICEQLNALLQEWGYAVETALDVSEAVACLGATPIDFAIVDVYLKGARGKELSASFIHEYLEPRAIPYGRFTSAPEAVPPFQRGLWVLHKHEVERDHSLLREALLSVCAP